MATEIIIHTERITQAGNSRNFQVTLPRDTMRVVSIATGILRIGIDSPLYRARQMQVTVSPMAALPPGGTPTDPPPDPPPGEPPPEPETREQFRIKLTAIAGRLTLMMPGAMDIFFQQEVIEADVNMGYGDFTRLPLVLDKWGYSPKSEPDLAITNSCVPILEGHYKDNRQVFTESVLAYVLNIYIRIEK